MVRSPAIARRSVARGIDAGAARRLLSRALHDIGRLLVVLGVVVILVGVVFLAADRVPWLGRLPGDFTIRRGPLTVYFPLATSIVLSIVLTVLLNIFFRR